MGLKKYVACHGSFLTASCLKCKKKRTAEDIRVSSDLTIKQLPPTFCLAAAAIAVEWTRWCWGWCGFCSNILLLPILLTHLEHYLAGSLGYGIAEPSCYLEPHASMLDGMRFQGGKTTSRKKLHTPIPLNPGVFCAFF